MEPAQARFLMNVSGNALAQEFEPTLNVLRAVPEDRKDHRPDTKARNAFDLAWHIANSERWFAQGICRGEFHFDPEEEDGPPPEIKTMADLAAWYEKGYPTWIKKLNALSDDQLARQLDFFGTFHLPAVQYLGFMTSHTIHHRGQLSTYLRPMGSKAPSIYGGSADEPFVPPSGQTKPTAALGSGPPCWLADDAGPRDRGRNCRDRQGHDEVGRFLSPCGYHCSGAPSPGFLPV